MRCETARVTKETDVINPNAKHIRYGRVTKLKRETNPLHSRCGSLDLEVTLVDGTKLNELGFVYHKTLKVGDFVLVTVGFRITSDRYGIETVRKSKHAEKLHEFRRNVESITHADVEAYRSLKAVSRG